MVVKQRRYPRRAPAPAAQEQPEPLPTPAPQAAAYPSSPDAHTTLDVEITNQHLLGMLTVESATLLAHFAMQVA